MLFMKTSLRTNHKHDHKWRCFSTNPHVFIGLWLALLLFIWFVFFYWHFFVFLLVFFIVLLNSIYFYLFFPIGFYSFFKLLLLFFLDVFLFVFFCGNSWVFICFHSFFIGSYLILLVLIGSYWFDSSWKYFFNHSNTALLSFNWFLIELLLVRFFLTWFLIKVIN